ncbi:hypothetical protein AMPC_19900 [Anaeromyxobacter paludicola]|uniref:Uncharacterized protein n=1 Tax=Anaeromyxobacter paludicola TaxID=2918171 RepID=A0ABM7XAJ6_9BACT|nr:hypothetical protein AMPC_19900 [Anaeromyxobacter paludicola]
MHWLQGVAVPRSVRGRSRPVPDLAFAAASIAFFGLSYAYVLACDVL